MSTPPTVYSLGPLPSTSRSCRRLRLSGRGGGIVQRWRRPKMQTDVAVEGAEAAPLDRRPLGLMRDAHRLIGPAILPEWRPEARYGRLDEQHHGSPMRSRTSEWTSEWRRSWDGGEHEKKNLQLLGRTTRKKERVVKSKKSAEPAFHVTHACLGA